jgi:hypothetical protein
VLCLRLFLHLQLLSDAAPLLINVSRLRLVNAGARGADAAALASALLQLRSLRVLQLHQVCGAQQSNLHSTVCLVRSLEGAVGAAADFIFFVWV